VILDTNASRAGTGRLPNASAGGVKVVWADTSYEATHQKPSRSTAPSRDLVGQFTEEYYSTTRDFGVFDHNQADVRAIEAVFARTSHTSHHAFDGSDLCGAGLAARCLG